MPKQYLVQLLGHLGRGHFFIVLVFAWRWRFLLVISRWGCSSGRRLGSEESVIPQIEEQLEAAFWKRCRSHVNPEALDCVTDEHPADVYPA
jgi:hypothetical protein